MGHKTSNEDERENIIECLSILMNFKLFDLKNKIYFYVENLINFFKKIRKIKCMTQLVTIDQV
jgi:hypothetical protein